MADLEADQEWHQQDRTKRRQLIQGLSLALFLVAGLVCWYAVATITENPLQDLIAIATVGGLGAYSSFRYFQWLRYTTDILDVFENAELDITAVIYASTTSTYDLKPLEPIWEKLRAGRLHHRDILVHISSLQFAMASTLIISSLGGAVAAFFILPSGWELASPTQKTLFLALIVMVTYCQITPRVLSLNSNLALHLARYQAFLALRWQVYRYVVTGLGADGKLQSNRSFLNDLIQRLVELPPAPFGIDPSQVGSVTALAQQFSFITQPRSASDGTTPAGAGQGDGAETAHNQGSDTARKGQPHYSHPNTYALRELGGNMVLATIDGAISKAEDIKHQLPKWMSLDTTRGTICLMTVEQAEAGSCAAAIRLTLADEGQTEVIVAVLITIIDTAQ